MTLALPRAEPPFRVQVGQAQVALEVPNLAAAQALTSQMKRGPISELLAVGMLELAKR